MSTPRNQVLELVSSGKISTAEGDELLKALGARASSRWKLLLNPFEQLNSLSGLGLGGVGAAIAILLSRWNVRFDGALDVHISSGLVSWRQAVFDQVVAWLLVAVLLWGVALAFARQGRLVDFLSSVGTARLPLLIVGIVAGAMKSQLSNEPGQVGSAPPVAVLVLVAATLPALVWAVTMMFQGYRTASGLRGTRCALSFTAGIIVAEVLSKFSYHFIQ